MDTNIMANNMLQRITWPLSQHCLVTYAALACRSLLQLLM